jgi:hypothetical protein
MRFSLNILDFPSRLLFHQNSVHNLQQKPTHYVQFKPQFQGSASGSYLLLEYWRPPEVGQVISCWMVRWWCIIGKVSKKQVMAYYKPHPRLLNGETDGKQQNISHKVKRSSRFETSNRISKSVFKVWVLRPASWSSGQSFWLLIMIDSRLYHEDFSLKGKIPMVTMVWVV